MCCIRGVCILAPGANVSANLIFHPVWQLVTSLILTDLLQLDKIYKLVATCSEVDILQQVCGVCINGIWYYSTCHTIFYSYFMVILCHRVNFILLQSRTQTPRSSWSRNKQLLIYLQAWSLLMWSVVADSLIFGKGWLSPFSLCFVMPIHLP